MEAGPDGITRWAQTDIGGDKILRVGLNVVGITANGLRVTPINSDELGFRLRESPGIPVFIVTVVLFSKSSNSKITTKWIEFGSRESCVSFLSGLKSAFELVGSPEVELPGVPHF